MVVVNCSCCEQPPGTLFGQVNPQIAMVFPFFFNSFFFFLIYSLISKGDGAVLLGPCPGPVNIPMAVVSRCRLAKNCDVEDFQDVICIAKVR